MRIIEVENTHALVREGCRQVLDPVRGVDDEHVMRLRDPVTFVIAKPLEAAPFWGADPFLVMAGRLQFTAMHLGGEGLMPAAVRLGGGGIQANLLVGDAGRLTYQCLDGALDAFLFMPYCELQSMDFGVASMLTEILAVAASAPVGRLWITTPSLCLNKRGLSFGAATACAPDANPYAHFARQPVVRGDVQRLVQELVAFAEVGPALGIQDPFLRRVATPILAARDAALNSELPRRFADARRILEGCDSEDWNQACSMQINKMEKS